MLKSLRSRITVASLLWTGGLLFIMHLTSGLLMHRVPMPRGGHAVGVSVFAGVLAMTAGLLLARGSLGLLGNLQGKVMAVRKGDAAEIAGNYPAEVQPLVDSLNELIADREASIRRAHAAAGDLAHGLKTPLAVLAREAEAARAAGSVELADAIGEQIRRMTSQVEYHLARARVAAADASGATKQTVEPCVAALIRTLEKIYAARGLEIRATVPSGLTVRVRQEDLEEMLGNLLDNACKWARSRVQVTAAESGDSTVFTVEDDGPGLPEPLHYSVLERGVRLDESAPGTGLGLSIVRDLVEHYSGTLALERSDGLGGLQVRLTLGNC